MTTKHTHFEKLTKIPAIGPQEKMEIELNKKADHFILTFRNFYEREEETEDGGKVTKTYPCASSSDAYNFSQRFLESKSLACQYPTRRISVPVTDISAIIMASWPIAQTYYEGKAYLKVSVLNKRVKTQRKAAELVAKYKEQNIYDNGVFQVSEKLPLATYQKVALHASVLADNYALFMEQGTGKTAAVVARICNAAEANSTDKPYRAIVVCPKNVKYNWKCEIEKFATCKGSVFIIDGNQLDRSKMLVDALVTKREGDKFTVLIMNYETVKTVFENMQLSRAILAQTEKFDFEKGKLFELGILDESHYIKTPSAQRTKSALQLREHCAARMLMTGTPITNHPFDLYAQLEFLEEGMSGFSSFSAFKNFYGVFEPGGMGYEKLVDLQNIPILKERLSRVSFQINKKVALPDLPEKLYDKYEVEMTAEQKELYKKIATELVAEIEMEQASGKLKKEFMVNHILTKLLRLAQVCSGFVGFSEVRDEETDVVLEEKSSYVMKDNPKLDALIEILKEKKETEKTIVWACFIQDIQSISERLTEEGIKHVTFYGATSTKARNEAVDAFNNDPSTKVFLGNPEAASTGLNLLGYPPENSEGYYTNCTHVIYFSQNWKSAPRVQSEDRAHRRGTRENVRITDLVVPNTIDTEIRDRVEKKREMAEDVGDVSEILSGILQSLRSI